MDSGNGMQDLMMPAGYPMWVKRKLDLKKLGVKETFTEKMKMRFDTPEGRSIYSKRMGTVEPVFGYLRGVLHLDRFTLRSKKKVNIQWLLYCMVHNI